MGHAISAIISSPPANEKNMTRYGLRMITLPQAFVLLPLTAELVDGWSDVHIDEPDDGHRPLLDCEEVREVARQVFGDRRFAIIETDYFGGTGDQAAAVYENHLTVMSSEAAELGPINRALELLGARLGNARDEFEALGLGRFRSWHA